MKSTSAILAMRSLVLFFPFVFVFDAIALEPVREASIRISIARFYRNPSDPSGEKHEESVCTKKATAPVFDFQREINPPIKIPAIYCATTLDGQKALVQINPAIVLRTLLSGIQHKQFRYHAVVLQADNPNNFRDIYGRASVTDPEVLNVTVDAAYDPGPLESRDAYWITVAFEDRYAPVRRNENL